MCVFRGRVTCGTAAVEHTHLCLPRDESTMQGKTQDLRGAKFVVCLQVSKIVTNFP